MVLSCFTRCGLALMFLHHVRGTATPTMDARYLEDHGQNEDGLPFYIDNPFFDEFIQTFKEIEPVSEIGPEIIQTMHEAFIGSSGDSDQIIDGWKHICVAIDHLSAIVGCLDAPSQYTGRRAIHQAVIAGDILKIKWLAEHGVDLDAYTAPNNEGFHSAFTPAHLAVMHRQLEALEVLENEGANVMLKNMENGYTPLDVAIEMGYDDIVQWFNERLKTEKDDL